jgi:multicomponent Na+:H+ antiporter subunit G
MEYIAYSLIGIGAFFIFSGALGILRMPDFFTRLHAASVIESLGGPCVVLGIALLHGWSLLSAKLILLILFLMITCPTATHMLSKAAYLTGSVKKG